MAGVVWNGIIDMPSLGAFQATAFSFSAYAPSGALDDISTALPTTMNVIGRAYPDQICEYLMKIKESNEICVLVMFPSSPNDATMYSRLLTYLDTRNRIAVIQSNSPRVKKVYMMPLAANNSLPRNMLDFIGREIKAEHPDLLFVIIVANNSVAGTIQSMEMPSGNFIGQSMHASSFLNWDRPTIKTEAMELCNETSSMLPFSNDMDSLGCPKPMLIDRSCLSDNDET